MAESSYLFINDLRVHYLHWNLADGNPMLVMLHGLASNAHIWELVADELASRGLALLAPDARGHGLTDKPEDGYDFETYTRDLAALLDDCDLVHPVLVGHSWGASVALEFAARFPVGPRAPAGVVLVDGGVIQMDAAGRSWEEMRDRLTPPRLAGMPLEALVGRLNGPDSHWRPDARALQIILGNFEVAEDETISPRLSFEHHMQIVRAMWEFKTYERFPRLHCPVLAIPARPSEPLSEPERDFLSNKERGLAIARERIRDFRLHWMADTIHDIPLQRPVELANLIAGFVTPLKQE